MKCENCNNDHDGSYGSGRFCSSKCARGFSTKEKREEINKKVSKKLSYPKVKKICIDCGKVILNKSERCRPCATKISNSNKLKRNKISKKLKKFYSNKNNRERLKQIGRKGGFGKKGFTKNNIRYESLLEKSVFEFLELNEIKFEAHKSIPNSTKISDLFLPKYNLWIELDGINRELKKKWLKNDYKYWIAKLDIYNELKLNYKIIYSLNEFKGMLAQLGERLVYTEEGKGS